MEIPKEKEPVLHSPVIGAFQIPAGAPEVKYNQSLSIESSAENKADSTSLLEECPEENKIIQLNDCEDNNQQVFFVECPEKERASALLCAALGWAQEYQPDSSIRSWYYLKERRMLKC